MCFQKGRPRCRLLGPWWRRCKAWATVLLPAPMGPERRINLPVLEDVGAFIERFDALFGGSVCLRFCSRSSGDVDMTTRVDEVEKVLGSRQPINKCRAIAKLAAIKL